LAWLFLHGGIPNSRLSKAGLKSWSTMVGDTGLEEYYCSCQLQESLPGPQKPMCLQAAALEPTSIWPRFTLRRDSLPSPSQLLPFTYDRPSLWWRSFGHIVAELLIPVAIKKVEKKISLFGSWGHAITIQPFWDHWARAWKGKGLPLIEESLWRRGCVAIDQSCTLVKSKMILRWGVESTAPRSRCQSTGGAGLWLALRLLMEQTILPEPERGRIADQSRQP
jgi:hypothetical protein